MPQLGSVALVSDDLMFRSQLEAAVRSAGGTFLPNGSPVVLLQAQRIFVDLNRDSGHRLGVIATLHQQRPEATIVGFCHHADKGLREAAMRAGAERCVTNGALQSVTMRLAGKRAPSARSAT